MHCNAMIVQFQHIPTSSPLPKRLLKKNYTHSNKHPKPAGCNRAVVAQRFANSKYQMQTHQNLVLPRAT